MVYKCVIHSWVMAQCCLWVTWYALCLRVFCAMWQVIAVMLNSTWTCWFQIIQGNCGDTILAGKQDHLTVSIQALIITDLALNEDIQCIAFFLSTCHCGKSILSHFHMIIYILDSVMLPTLFNNKIMTFQVTCLCLSYTSFFWFQCFVSVSSMDLLSAELSTYST